MPNRRKVLIGLGTSVAIAGCSGTSQSNEGETEQQESEQVEAEIFITNVQPKGTSFGAEEEFEITVTYQNRGEESGEFEVQGEFGGERSEPQMLQLDGGESETITIDIDASEYEAGNYEYTFFGGDKQESGSFIIEEPEAAPASFEVENYNNPDSVEIGEDASLEITVRNTGGQEGSYSASLYGRTPDTSWQEGKEVTFEDVGAGETATKEVISSSFNYINRYEFRLGTSSKTAVIQTVSAKIPWGEEYKTPAGYRIRVDEPERQSTYEYEDFQGNIVEKEPDSGGQWAFINVWVKNETGSRKFSPLASEFALLYDSSQADGETYLIDEPINKGESFDGGELQPGVERSGWIAYQIPGGALGNDDLTVAWSQTTIDGDIAANWEEE